jgi:hypothetical protein
VRARKVCPEKPQYLRTSDSTAAKGGYADAVALARPSGVLAVDADAEAESPGAALAPFFKAESAEPSIHRLCPTTEGSSPLRPSSLTDRAVSAHATQHSARDTQWSKEWILFTHCRLLSLTAALPCRDSL